MTDENVEQETEQDYPTLWNKDEQTDSQPVDDENVEPATRIDSKDSNNGVRYDNTESYRNFYRRLELWNRDDRNGKWVDEEKAGQDDRSAILDAVAGQLELTDYQKERAWYLLQQLGTDTFRANPTGLVCFCVCAIACREDGREWHPDRARESNDHKFSYFLRELGYGEEARESLVRKLYKRLDTELGE